MFRAAVGGCRGQAATPLGSIGREERRGKFMEMVVCSWCHANNQEGLSQCTVCGAPLNSDDRVSDSGFREAPRLRDMEEFTFSSSTLQIEGKYVPMVEINLHPDDSVYFEQHTI